MLGGMAWSSQGQGAGALSTLALTALLLPTSAAAAEPDHLDHLDHLDYQAPKECPAKDELVRAIEARTAPSRAEDMRTFRIVIERAPAGDFVGRLDVLGASGVPRVTRAADCAAVVKTLALFVVIARTPEEPPDMVPPASPSPSPSPVPPGTTPPPSPRALVVATHPPRATSRFRYTAAVRASLSTASSSEVTTGVRVQSELSWRAAGLPVAPLVRLSYGTATFDTAVEPGNASFRFRTGRLEACAAIDLGRHVDLVPCVGGELGDLVANTSNRPIAVRTATRWEAMTAGGGVRWSVLPWLALGADLVAVIPFTRKQFAVVEPVHRVYAAPPAFVEMGALAGVNADF
ncbi:hypothetical protein AKJ09_09356 [Labilithrix luteola]|uniref:Uncharacterized protein n=1 Tax=Labilithrix luteola TaxID=1391654 RepID=A0A0K1QAD0_9BACT|nr:hypothetical protein AKJ09_09356 [Labilithrix luteola]